MARRTPRWRTPPQKPLCSPSSARVIDCYAFEGKAYIFRPMLGEVVRLFVISPDLEVREVFSAGSYTSAIATDEVPKEWRVLGWRPFGEPRHGEFDRVDPEMADVAKLPLVYDAASYPTNNPLMPPGPWTEG